MNRIILICIILISGCNAQRMPPAESAQKDLSEDAVKGQMVFMEYCQKCHPGGSSGLGPSIINKPLPGFMIKLQVRTGMGVMPSFNKNILDKKELDDLVEYIQAL
jgi:mono/diheme cytochrome c family protein